MGSEIQNNADDNSSWMVPIQVMLGAIHHKEVHASSISKISDKIRKPNKAAYIPEVISIGPYYRGSENDLMLMEQPKWSYMFSLLVQSQPREEQENTEREIGNSEDVRNGPNKTLEKCGEAVMALDHIVRASYGGNILYEEHELAKTMLLDGFFLLEFLHRLHEYKEALNGADNNNQDDPVFQTQEKLSSVIRDLLLLENQIPFIVLKKLYRKLYPVGVRIEKDHRVATLALEALGYPSVVPTSGVAHLLHLVHLSILNIKAENETTTTTTLEYQGLKHCAKRLRARGITIRGKAANKKSNGVGADQNNWVHDNFDFEIHFDKNILEIPQLRITKSTEVTWRNLIAWEQSRIGMRCKLTSYALFFQSLICCEHDIELLERVKVIVNESGKSSEELLTMFRTMCDGVEYKDSSFSETCGKLNKDTGRSVLKKWPIVTWHQCRRVFGIIVYYWKNWYNVLIKEHIPTVWKLIGLLAAIALLGLTIAQTYYAAHSSN